MSQDKDSFSLPPTHMERIDLEELKHKQELEKLQIQEAASIKRERLKTAQSRHAVYAWIGGSVSVAAVLISITAAVYFGTSGPDEDKEILQEQYTKCIDAKGTWIPPGDYNDGWCIAEGHTANPVK